MSARELEFVLQELLRRKFMKDPHVGVFVREMQSHAVSLIGAVKEPGVYQIRGRKSLVEILSLAGGLSDDAGARLIVMRNQDSRLNHEAAASEQETDPSLPVAQPGTGGAPWGGRVQDSFPAATSIVIKVKDLLESDDPRHNITIFPGDIIKVTRAPIVYVVGEVNKPGGFILHSKERISVLQALALAEGLTRTAAKQNSVVIRTDENGQRSEILFDLGRVLKRKEPDIYLQPNDIVFIPNSATKTALIEGVSAALRTISGVIIFGTTR